MIGLSRRVRAYLALRALPTTRIDSVLARLEQVRGGGPVAQALTALHVAVDLAELVLLPNSIEPQLLAEGLAALPDGLLGQVHAWIQVAPDHESAGSLTDGSMATSRSQAMGVIIVRRAGYGERSRGFVDAPTFRAWVQRAVWGESGVLELVPASERARETISLGDRGWSVRAARAPRMPAPTSNPSPADVAAELPAASSAESPLRVVLLLGPSGSGKSMTAAAVSRTLGMGDRTMRVTGRQVRDADDLADIINLLEPSCVVMDDLPVHNIAPAMAMLDRLHQMVSMPLLLIITIMHEGPIANCTLPGFRPERVDAILAFHAPSSTDRVELLVFHGLARELAVEVADLDEVKGLTGAYLAELARRISGGADPRKAAASLALHRRIAGHNVAAPLVGADVADFIATRY